MTDKKNDDIRIAVFGKLSKSRRVRSIRLRLFQRLLFAQDRITPRLLTLGYFGERFIRLFPKGRTWGWAAAILRPLPR